MLLFIICRKSGIIIENYELKWLVMNDRLGMDVDLLIIVLGSLVIEPLLFHTSNVKVL